MVLSVLLCRCACTWTWVTVCVRLWLVVAGMGHRAPSPSAQRISTLRSPLHVRPPHLVYVCIRLSVSAPVCICLLPAALSLSLCVCMRCGRCLTARLGSGSKTSQMKLDNVTVRAFLSLSLFMHAALAAPSLGPCYASARMSRACLPLFVFLRVLTGRGWPG
jgi:hypothetical protein